MKTNVMFLDCPAYLDEQAGTRCGLPAEVQYRYTVKSTSGPLESAKIRCPRNHWFNGPVEFLTWRPQRSAVEQERAHDPAGLHPLTGRSGTPSIHPERPLSP